MGTSCTPLFPEQRKEMTSVVDWSEWEMQVSPLIKFANSNVNPRLLVYRTWFWEPQQSRLQSPQDHGHRGTWWIPLWTSFSPTIPIVLGFKHQIIIDHNGNLPSAIARLRANRNHASSTTSLVDDRMVRFGNVILRVSSSLLESNLFPWPLLESFAGLGGIMIPVKCNFSITRATRLAGDPKCSLTPRSLSLSLYSGRVGTQSCKCATFTLFLFTTNFGLSWWSTRMYFLLMNILERLPCRSMASNSLKEILLYVTT